MNEKQIESAIEFLNGLNVENLDVMNYLDKQFLREIDMDNAYYAIRDKLQERNAFDVEIIYHGIAMEYLMKNDCSLRESLGIASDMGFDCNNLNSETLASLLATQECMSDFDELQSDIDDFFIELQNEETEE